MSRRLILAFSLALVACGGGPKNGYVDTTTPSPAMTPNLAELPDDKRDQILDSSRARPDPEQRKRDLKPKERKAEVGAAVGAAILGEAFSKTHNADLGFESAFDETGNLQKMKKSHPPEKDDPSNPPGPITQQPVEPPPASKDLVPWVKVAPAPKTGDAKPPEQKPAN